MVAPYKGGAVFARSLVQVTHAVTAHQLKPFGHVVGALHVIPFGCAFAAILPNAIKEQPGGAQPAAAIVVGHTFKRPIGNLGADIARFGHGAFAAVCIQQRALQALLMLDQEAGPDACLHLANLEIIRNLALHHGGGVMLG